MPRWLRETSAFVVASYSYLSFGSRLMAVVGQMLIKHLGYELFGVGWDADDPLNLLPVFEEDQGRYALNPKAGHALAVLIYIHFEHFCFALVFLCNRFDGRRYSLTRSAPLRPKVDQDRFRGLQDFRLESLSIYFIYQYTHYLSFHIMTVIL